MTLPEAKVVHQHRRRIRLRIPSKRYDDGYFVAVRRELSAYPDMADVRVNAHTASVLLITDIAPADLRVVGEERQLFHLAEVIPSAGTLLDTVSQHVDAAETVVLRYSNGAYGLSEILFVFLLLASGVQLLRGRVAGPASSLLSYATTLLLVHRARQQF